MLPRIPLLPKPPQSNNKTRTKSNTRYSAYYGGNNNNNNMPVSARNNNNNPPGTSQSTASGGSGSFSLPPLQKQNNNNNGDVKMSRKTSKLLADLEAAASLLEQQNNSGRIVNASNNDQKQQQQPSSKVYQQQQQQLSSVPKTTTPRSVLSSLVNNNPPLSSQQQQPVRKTVVISSSRKPIGSTALQRQQQQQQRRSSSNNNNNNMLTHHNHKARGTGLCIEEAILHFEDILAPFEIDELIRQQQQQEKLGTNNARIYFCGLDSKRKLPSAAHYDDEGCDYKTIPGDHVGYRYEVLSFLGKGSFGQVVKALDHKTGHTVALKIIKNKKKFHEQASIERHILEFLNTNHNDAICAENDIEEIFVRLRDSIMFRGHCVFVFDLHGLNLYDRLKANNFASTPMYLIQQYARQLLNALDFTSRNGLVHCDLKPENILVTKGNPASIRLIDFGSSCFMNARIHTYIQSRFYRAPEICLGIPYTSAIDVWSLGVMLYELYFGNPLFAVQSEPDLIGQITARLGQIPQSLYDRAPRKKHFYDLENGGINRLKKVKSSHSKLQTLSSIFYSSGNSTSSQELALLGDLISKMVRWDPASRITPAEALRHPFLNKDIAVPRSLQSNNSSNHHQPKTARQQKHYQQSSLIGGSSVVDSVAPLTSRRKVTAAAIYQ